MFQSLRFGSLRRRKWTRPPWSPALSLSLPLNAQHSASASQLKVANGAPVSRSHTFSRGAHKPHPKWTSFKIEALTAQTDLKPRHLDAWYEERSEHRSGFELRYAPAFPFWYARLANGAEAF